MRTAFRFLGGSVFVFFGVLFTLGTMQLIYSAAKGVIHRSSGGRAHVLIVPITGVISSSATLLKQVRDAIETKNVKAIVLRVNSPGGLVAPSEELYRGFRRFDEKIPVVVSMAQVAASGGYYISMAGRKLFANAGSMTGSIGVVLEFVNLEKLYSWARIDRYMLTAGKMKGAGADTRALKPEERKLFQGMLDNIHQQFRDTVMERRKIEANRIEDIADGRVFTGQQAKEVNLVDEIGTLDDAIREAKKMAKLDDDAPVREFEAPRGWLDMVLDPQNDNIDTKTFAEWSRGMRLIEPSNEGWHVMLMSPIR